MKSGVQRPYTSGGVPTLPSGGRPRKGTQCTRLLSGMATCMARLLFRFDTVGEASDCATLPAPCRAVLRCQWNRARRAVAHVHVWGVLVFRH
jgi:hypothetical protein